MTNPLRHLVATLSLTYPPISNQEAEWVKTSPEAVALIRESDFYLIGIRPEVFFSDPVPIAGGRFRVDIDGDGDLHDTAEIEPEILAQRVGVTIDDAIGIEAGPKLLRLRAGPSQEIQTETGTLFDWFTADKLIRDRLLGVPGISGFDRAREFATYELLYVGIAKAQDTFDRLFATAHHARQKILSNEWPRRPGARITDEMVLFPMRVDPVLLRDFNPGRAQDQFDDEQWTVLRKKTVADAEKAFVHLLDPQYNVEKFRAYPAGTDGLAGTEFTQRSFALAENITFTTEKREFYGSGNPQLRAVYNDADTIYTDGVHTTVRSALREPRPGPGSCS